MNKLKKWQTKIFILCWLAYAFAYLGRTNLSIAIPSIENSLQLSSGKLGLLASLFFWSYGIGQLINGYIGDRRSSKRLIFIGLIVSAFANLLFGFSTNYIVMGILWMINGYFLSMLWGPIMKTLSHWFSVESRSNVAIGISTSMVGGFLLAWGFIGFILSFMEWNWAFWIPGIIIFIFSILFLIFSKDSPTDVHMPPISEEISEDKKASELSLLKVISETKLWFVVIACYAQGIVKDGISLWAPKLLMDTHHLDIESAVPFIIFIPIMNFFGMLLASKLNKRFNNKEKLTAVVLFVLGIITLIGLIKLGAYSPILAIIFLGLSSAMMYGANTILLGVIPLAYVKYNKTSSVAGFLDFNSYMAAGLSSLIAGFSLDRIGWNGILIFWIVMIAVAILALYRSLVHDRLKA